MPSIRQLQQKDRKKIALEKLNIENKSNKKKNFFFPNK